MKHLKPSFIIIGERKCGTSSLYRYLIDHPNILPCKVKEPQFFVRNPWRIWWHIQDYYRLFPTRNYQGDLEIIWPELDTKGQLYQEKLHIKREPDQWYITGEASAETFYRARPKVVQRYLPKAKLILMLRNPVDRVFSHYRMLQRYKAEGRKLATPISDFEKDMFIEMEKVKRGEHSFFLTPSLYHKSLKKWLEVFDSQQFYIIRTEDLHIKARLLVIMEELCSFLKIPKHDFGLILDKQFNKAPTRTLPEPVGSHLTEFFEPHNLKLETLLGRKMDWS